MGLFGNMTFDKITSATMIPARRRSSNSTLNSLGFLFLP
jgi:hypothetical protein